VIERRVYAKLEVRATPRNSLYSSKLLKIEILMEK
jgi:hypothetical protein